MQRVALEHFRANYLYRFGRVSEFCVVYAVGVIYGGKVDNRDPQSF